MDRFFDTTGSLMSRLLRHVVQSTILDFVNFIEEYKDGNNYSGTYDIFKGLALPHLVLPIKVFFVPVDRTGNVTMDPKLDVITNRFNECIDYIVNSLQWVSTIEYQLFHQVKGLNMKYLKTVTENEEIIITTKERIKRIFDNNSFGPVL
jgi:hypothetical protein